MLPWNDLCVRISRLSDQYQIEKNLTKPYGADVVVTLPGNKKRAGICHGCTEYYYLEEFDVKHPRYKTKGVTVLRNYPVCITCANEILINPQGEIAKAIEEKRSHTNKPNDAIVNGHGFWPPTVRRISNHAIVSDLVRSFYFIF